MNSHQKIAMKFKDSEIRVDHLPDQSFLMEVMKKLGYPEEKFGLCFGITHMAKQAILADQFDTFIDRLLLIEQLNYTIPNDNDDKDDKNNSSENIIADLTQYITMILEEPQDKNQCKLIAVNVLAFLDGIELYQNSHKYIHFFDLDNTDRIHQHDMTPFVLSLTSPEILNNTHEKIVELYSATANRNKKEFIIFLKNLINLHQTNTNEFPVIFEIQNHNHSISIRYNAILDKWQLIDANQLYKINYSYDINEITNEVFSAFEEKSILSFMVSSHIKENLDEEFKKSLLIPYYKNNLKDSILIHKKTVNRQDSNGFSHLHIATMRGDIETIDKLISMNANLNIQSNHGFSPLHFASSHSYLDIIKKLIRHGADINIESNNGTTPLHCATAEKHLDAVKLLISSKNFINKSDKYGATPLHFAAYTNQLDIVEALICHGLPIDTQNINGDTALHTALKRGHLEIAELLINHTNNFNIQNGSTLTPRAIAFINNYFQIVDLIDIRTKKSVSDPTKLRYFNDKYFEKNDRPVKKTKTGNDQNTPESNSPLKKHKS